MKIKGLKETIIRRNGNKEEYIWEVKQASEKEYSCPQLGFTLNIETGETNKKQGIGKGFAKIGETFENAGRQITYEIIYEEEPQQEQAQEQPTTLVQEWRYEDGRIEVKGEYKGCVWEKGPHKRLYIEGHNKGAYVDLKTNTFHPDRNKAYPIGEWKKNWGATVEFRYILR